MKQNQISNTLFILLIVLFMLNQTSSGKLSKMLDPARDEEDFSEYDACSDRKNKERCSEALNLNGPYKCVSDLDCRGKRVCMLNTCKHECKSTKDCPKGMKCYDNACYAHKSHHSRIKSMNEDAKGKSRHRGENKKEEEKGKKEQKEEESKNLKGLNGEKHAVSFDFDHDHGNDNHKPKETSSEKEGNKK